MIALEKLLKNVENLEAKTQGLVNLLWSKGILHEAMFFGVDGKWYVIDAQRIVKFI